MYNTGRRERVQKGAAEKGTDLRDATLISGGNTEIRCENGIPAPRYIYGRRAKRAHK